MRKPIPREIIIARAKKASATKLAKRILKKCLGCGKEWLEKPSHSWRVYCSYRCAGKAKQKEPNLKTCIECGKQFPSTWKVGRGSTCSPQCAHRRHSRRMIEEGRNPRDYHDQSKWLESLRTKEYRESVSKRQLGRIANTPKTKRNSHTHACATECFLRDPRGIIHYVSNITAFVHEHEHLFDATQIVWKPGKGKRWKSINCHASHGLATVARGYRLSWRGWTFVSGREGRESCDMIQRTFKPNEPRL